MLQSVELTIPGCTPVARDICTSERGNRAAVPRPTTTASLHVARELSALERDNRAAVPGPTITAYIHVAGEDCISVHVNRAGSQSNEQYLQLQCAHPSK